MRINKVNIINRVKQIAKSNKFIYISSVKIINFFHDFQRYRNVRIEIQKPYNIKRIYYIGIPTHPNLGDQAQYLCIRCWIKKNFGDFHVIEIPNQAIADTHFSVLRVLSHFFKDEDLIIFQSGYTTTDLSLGDEVHQAVICALPNAKMLMMPQTVYYSNDINRKKAEKIYNKASHMLFLARDKVSFEIAQKIFPCLKVLLYPDIVTTMIGKYTFHKKRKGILFCIRSDKEKLYSDDQIDCLIQKCNAIDYTEKTDTTKTKMLNSTFNVKHCIEKELDFFSNFKLIVTDRYHGTIFSLISGTPVIILKTKDHKVITGADWFKDDWNSFVKIADNLDHAFLLIKSMKDIDVENMIKPCFEEKYYNKLKNIFLKEISNKNE